MSPSLTLAVTPTFAEDWTRMVAAVGPLQRITLLDAPPVQDPTGLWIVVLPNDSPTRWRFWLRTLQAPAVLITPHMSAARTLAVQLPHIRVICHPTRAVAALEDMVAMAQSFCDTTMIFGPLRSTHAPHRSGGAHYGAV